MSIYVLSIALTIAANVGYHLLQRSIRPDLSPVVSLVATYATALVISLLAWPLFCGDATLTKEIGKLGWMSFALGAAVVLLELGFLLAYRAGWNISVAALYSNAAVALLLIPVGVLALAEGMSPRKMLGFAFALVGLVLLSQKPASS